MKRLLLHALIVIAPFSSASAQTVLDTDGDGMPDAWEISMGLNPNDDSDALSDLDGDRIPKGVTAG